jgi:thiol-disulfide isomerase/thioredoxin
MLRSYEKLARGLCAAAGLAAALYVIPGCSSNPGGAVDLKSLAKGDMAKLAVNPPTPAPDAPFTDAAGKAHTLAEFKGKVVVLNIWATWCAPCVAEMPTLAKLAADTAGQPVVVLAVSVDKPENRANAMAFIAKHAPLGFYADPTYAIVYAIKPPAEAVPETVLIDPSGQVRAELGGGADWSGADARRVIEALEKPS